MCDVATAIAVGSTIFGAVQQRQQAKYQEGVARFNERQAENDAVRARNVATEKEMTHREKVQRLAASQRAAFAAGGVDISSGSALQIQEDTLIQGEADALRIRDTGDQQVESFNTDAMFQSSRADAFDSTGSNILIGGALRGAGQIAGTGVADKWFTSDSAANDIDVSQFDFDL